MPDGNTPVAPLRSIVVNEFTNSVLDPAEPMLGPVADGGTVIANTAPGCWGPMITPRLRERRRGDPPRRGRGRPARRCARGPYPRCHRDLARHRLGP